MRSVLRLPCVAVALAVAVAGCGGDDDMGVGGAADASVPTVDAPAAGDAAPGADAAPRADGGPFEGVPCEGATCLDGQVCCVLLGGRECRDEAQCPTVFAECDGLEDCGRNQDCCMEGGGGATCGQAGECSLALCHDGSDCGSGVCCPQGFCGPGCD